MNPDSYAPSRFGVPNREPGNRWSFWYFQPRPIPRTLALSDASILALSKADAALGQLHGLGFLIPNPELLIGPYLTREAVASSRIEGTRTTFEEVLRAEATTESTTDENVLEVRRYVDASRLAFTLSESLPISRRLILQVHKALLDGVRGQQFLPGQFRESPVWVGAAGASLETARYVPPLPGEIPALIADWERYINEERSAPVLIQAALTHYQFETIHPFLDGNGRIGRLLVNLFLKEREVLTQPLLYISGFLEAHRDEYYDRLQAVRERGDIDAWLQFFLSAVTSQANDGIWRARSLVALREDWMRDAQTSKSRLTTVIDALFANPFLTVRSIQRATTYSPQGARGLIEQAAARGWVQSLGRSGQGGRELWCSRRLLEIIDAPVQYRADRSIGGSG